MVKKAKKLLAVILSAILILSVVPLSVFTAAAESVTGYISAPLLSLGVTTNVSYDGTETSGAFRFCPDSSGVYILNSKGYLDTYVRVLDENGNQIGYNDDGGQNNNFQLDLNLESGKSYYLLTRLCNASSSGNYEIIITETPVERIEVEDISVIEGTSGYYSGYWDDSEYVEYWRYSYSYPAFTIYFKDKTSKTVEKGSGGTEIDGTRYYLSTTDNQSYDNQWTVGNSYTVDCTFIGVSSSFNVNITENPVERIEVEDISIIEGTSGYYNSGWNGSENVEYWRYYSPNPAFTIYFKDKTSKTVGRGNSGTDIDGTWYYLSTTDNQSYDNQWTVGNSYTVDCTFMGVSSSFNVTVIERPDFDYFEQDGGVIITNYNKQDENIEIPAEISGKPVIGVNYLGYCNFKSVTIPASVKFLSDGAFYKDSLENIFVSPDNEYYSDVDGVLTNKSKTKIIVYPLGRGNTYTVPAGILDVSVFDDWHYENVSIIFDESQFTNIGGVLYTKDMKTVVKCKTEVSGSYTMPDTVTEIMPKAFVDCDKITDVKISSNVTEITYAAFAGCTAMTSVDLPSGLMTIGEEAFEDSGLTSVSIPDSVTSVCYYAFSGCEKLESVGMPQNLTEIQGATFSGCSSLKTINIPRKVTSIGWGAFSGCESLSSIDLPNGLQTIQGGAFSGSGLTSIIIPDSVTEMYWGAFEWCDSLGSVTIGKGLSEICDSVFLGCTALESITIPENIEWIDWNAFCNCSSLKTVVFENDDIEIYDYAFVGCDLSNTTLPKNLKVIERGVFEETKIKNAKIPGTVTDIVYHAYYRSDVETIEMPDSVEHISAYSFDETPWLEAQPDGPVYINHIFYIYKGNISENAEVSVNDGTTVIADDAFAMIWNRTGTGPQKVLLPEGLKYIGEEAFYNCSALDSIVLPASVIEIGYSAFGGCIGLKDVYYTGTKEQKEKINIYWGNDNLKNATWHYNCDPDNLICSHTETEIRNAKDATCTEAGYTGDTYCKSCGEKISSGNTIPATGHKYRAKVTAPTCTERGYTTYTCSVCNDTYTDNYTDPLAHNETIIKGAVKATCTVDGYTGDTYCKLCDMKLSSGEVIPATGHKYVWKTVKIATETENGIKEEVCSRCGEKTGRTEPIAYTGHITGDINGDRIVNNKDIIRLFQYLSGWNVTINQSALDINGDGDINNKDITRLFKYLSGWAVEIK